MAARRVVACALLLLLALPSIAAGIPGQVLLGFCDTYAGPDGSARTHRGVDIAADAGAEFESPAPGTVKFVGRVPAAGGGTLLCVTVETPSGVMSVMPFDSAEVAQGDEVADGDRLGTVAAAGDQSSPEPHVHIGLKRGGVYVDPMQLIGATPVATAPATAAPAAQPAPVQEATVDHGVDPTPASGAVMPESQSVPVAGGSPAVGTVGDGVGATVSAGQGATVEAPTTLPEGVSLAGEPAGTSVVALDGTPQAFTSRQVQASADTAARTATSRALNFATGHLAGAIGLLAAILAACAMLVTRRSLTRRVTGQHAVSDRLGILLQHLKAGDTICGLTSCSGPLPSQSRGH